MVLYVDGGCSGNDQKDMKKRKMLAVVALPDGTIVHESEHEGGSNNIAELLALEAAYQWAVSQQCRDDLTVCTDSQNNLSWGSLKKPGKHLNDRERVLAIQRRIDGWLKQLPPPTLEWIPRDDNVAGWHIEAKYGL